MLISDLEEWHLKILDRLDFADVAIGRFSFAALVDGVPVAAGGIIQCMWPGRGYAWLISKNPPCWAWVGITRAIRKGVEMALDTEYHRLEMYVRENDLKARAWAELIGFQCEGFHPGLFSDGGSGYSYGRTIQKTP